MCDFFVFKQKTAYEMRISDWSSDVCSSDLLDRNRTQCIFADLELHTFHREQPGVLLDQRVLRFLEDRHQRRLIKFFEDRADRQTADEFGKDRKSTRLNSSH